MANTKSARKAARQAVRRTAVNKSRRTRLHTAVVKIEDAIASGDRAQAIAALKDAEPVIMRAAQIGVIHKNAASRKVSRLTHRVTKLGQ
jgi:small subunit ribosomal protein S20